MAYGLQDFYKTATRYSFARNNLLRLQNISGDTKDNKPIFPIKTGNVDFYIYLRTGSIPSRKINTATVNWKSFQFHVPLEAEYPESTSFPVTFYCDKYYIMRDIFERWSDATYNEHTFSTNTNFYDCNVQLDLLDNSDPNVSITEMKTVKKYTLYGCFPNNIGQLSYDTSSSGEVVSQSANLTFQYLTSETGPFNVN
jgi:hypothetical protein